MHSLLMPLASHRPFPPHPDRLEAGASVVADARQLRRLEKAGEVQSGRERHGSRQRDGQLPNHRAGMVQQSQRGDAHTEDNDLDRKSTRLNSSH